jgi:hypothetical protein
MIIANGFLRNYDYRKSLFHKFMAPIALKIIIGPAWHIENVNGNYTENLVGYGSEFW